MRDLKARGANEPKLVVGDGALGIWAALRDVFPNARRQACWVHAIANLLDALPSGCSPGRGRCFTRSWKPPRVPRPGQARQRFREEFDAKYPKAVARLDRDWQHLTAFYDFPAEHWRHLRTSTTIESSFATVKLDTRVSKGAGSKKAALAMAYKLLDAVHERWRRFNGHELHADVLAGVTYKDGIKVTDDNNDDSEMTDERVAA
jgi:putative transposase